MLAAALAVGHPVAGVAERPARFDPAPREGVLLLRNGEAIQGKIARAGDHYRVAVPKGEIRVRAADVEFTCDTLEEGYFRKRSDIRLGTAGEHLQLGEWCQRHGLIDFAEQELAKAEAAEATHPLIPVLRRRLEIARRPPQKPQPRAEPAEQPLSPDDLDRLVRGMPPGSVETFTQTIQPLLMNHCTTAGCHGPQSDTGYRLLRTPAGKPAGRRITQRNLHATLEWIDRKKPAASPLLTVPMRPHGTARTAVFSKGQAEQCQRIVDWVFRLAQASTASPPARVQGRDPWLSQAMRPSAARAGAAPADPAEKEAKGPKTGSPCPFDGRDTGPLDDGQRRLSDPRRGRYEPPHRSPPEHGEPQPGFVPADPFDPEIFNRRFFPNKGGQS